MIQKGVLELAARPSSKSKCHGKGNFFLLYEDPISATQWLFLSTVCSPWAGCSKHG